MNCCCLCTYLFKLFIVINISLYLKYSFGHMLTTLQLFHQLNSARQGLNCTQLTLTKAGTLTEADQPFQRSSVTVTIQLAQRNARVNASGKS